MDGNGPAQDARRIDPAPGGFVYWSLVLMGLTAFAPAVLLPEWRAVEALRVREQLERRRLENLENAVDRERRMIEGLRGDPAVIGRVAQRELGFRRVEDQSVLLRSDDFSVQHQQATKLDTMVDLAVESDQTPDDTPVDSPSGVPMDGAREVPEFFAGLARLAPPLPYDRLYGHGGARTIMMILGMSAIGAAVLLFGRRPNLTHEA